MLLEMHGSDDLCYPEPGFGNNMLTQLDAARFEDRYAC
jgi:hypothetical protein